MSKPAPSLAQLVPGVAVALAIAGASIFLADQIGARILGATGPSPVSPITVAILIGILGGNLIGVSPKLKPGLDFCVHSFLRLGIVLIGLKLSLIDVVKLGKYGVPVVMIVIATGLSCTLAIARWVGLSDSLGLVTAAATAICGVTAAIAVAPVVEATDEELSYAVANVTLFGVIGMLGYPYLAHAVFGSNSLGAGLFLGTSIHDTSQVMGAALSYRQLFQDDTAFKLATVTKLTRNVFLVVVVPLLAWLHARGRGKERKETSFAALFPRFVLYFLAMVALRTAGDSYWPSAGWTTFYKTLSDTVASVALAAALASVGLTTRLAQLRGLGLQPMFVGCCAALLVGSVGMGLALLVSRLAGS